MPSDETLVSSRSNGKRRWFGWGPVWWRVILPVVGLALATWFFRATSFDLNVTRLFYRAGEGWPHRDAWLWAVLYNYGPWPTVALGGLAFALLVFSYWSGRFRTERRAAFYVLLTLVVAPGIIVNWVLKTEWGRPRPREVQEFRGTLPFRKVLDLGPSGPNGSFPSGHAATGFALMTPYFALRRRRHAWAVGFLALGLVYGGLMGMGRIVQGQHFVSDIVWSAAVVYFTALALAKALHMDDPLEPAAAAKAGPTGTQERQTP